MIVSRIAPTPSGLLHKGNAFNFLLTWLMVRKNNGLLHLRIDDIDQTRARAEYLDDIFKSLTWLGINWDQGPRNREEVESTYSQIHHLDSYQEFLNELREKDSLFVCRKSRKDIQEHSFDGLYPDAFRSNAGRFEEETIAWRILTPWPLAWTWQDLNLGLVEQPIDPGLKDAVVRKKDGMPSYQITSVVDDLRMGVNLIVRGKDLLGSSAFQLWLLGQSDKTQKILFFHHDLLLDAQREKLSKSTGATSLRHQYESGKSPEYLLREFARWMGWTSFEGHTADDLLTYVTSNDLLI